MKKFTVQSISFLVAALLVICSIDYAISLILRQNTKNCLLATENAMMRGEINADMLIFGNSRGVHQYSTIILDSILQTNSYNLSLAAKTFYTQSMRYDVYRIKNKKPKVWIQNIDFMATLGLYTTNDIDNFEAEKYIHYPYYWNCAYMQAMRRNQFNTLNRWIPLYRYRGGIDKFIEPSFNATAYKGYKPANVAWRGDNMPDTLHFYCFDEVKSLFCEYMAKAKADSIEVVFVYAPIWHKVLERAEGLDEYYATFDSIATANDIPILDYSYSYLSYDTLYFFDSSHMNQRGAELFSTMLANDLDSLGIIH